MARDQAREILGLDELNWSYFFRLYEQYQRRNRLRAGEAPLKPLRIHEPGKDPKGRRIAYPTAIAPPDLLAHLPQVEYSELRVAPERYDEAARDAALWIKKMQAGSGSSMTRTSYLSRRLGIAESEVRIGAKGTDLFVDTVDPRDPSRREAIPLAEAQILQAILDFQRGEIGEVIFHDIVSSETEEAVRALWAKPSLLDPHRTYGRIVSETAGLRRFGETHQDFIPSLDEGGKASFGRRAPGGHALFAVEAIRAAFREDLRPRAEGKTLVSSISNGEDLSGSPDRFMVGYLVRRRIPIALVTTEKTAVDLKGGVISLLRDEKGAISLTVLETAQAREAGQQALFDALRGAMNTNLAIFNYGVLSPLLTREAAEIGEDELMRIVSPDLISNVKEQKDADGVTRSYLQLEGAMGSTLMNLDRYWRQRHGEPLVHLIHVDRTHRTEFFSPIKSAFDFFMQFHSDRFVFDPATMRLQNLRPGELPRVSLSDPATRDRYYQDVQTVLDVFHGASVRGLDELVIEGQVGLHDVILRGTVRIVNRSGLRVELGADAADGAAGVARGDGEVGETATRRVVLENRAIEIGTDGVVRSVAP